MTKREKIKVIKKGEKKAIETPVVPPKKTEPQNAAQMALLVSGWIDEFQLRRKEETETALERFNA